MEIIFDDILNIDVDVIVNASNGIGFMGGFLGKYFKFSGLAEYLHYKSFGKIEKEAKKECKINKNLPRFPFNHLKKGDIFITNSYLSNCDKVYHAITMTYPGTKSSLKIIDVLCDNGFHGYVTLKWEKCWHEELPECEIAFEGFNKYFKRV